MAQSKVKVPSLEERLANVLSQKGVPKFTRASFAAGLPHGSIVYTDVATSDNLRRYADAIGDFNPRFRDADYAKVTKYGRLVAQPTFLESAVPHCSGHEEVSKDLPDGYQTAGARAFNTANEWEYFQPVLEGDKLDFYGVGFVDAKIEKNKFSGEPMLSGDMMVTVSLCQYHNQRGEVLALAKSFVDHSRSDQESIQRGKEETFIQPYRYSDEEIARIAEDKKKEEMRGNWPRYWEDVAEGDSIGQIVVGPWTIMSFFAWMAAAGMRGIRFPLPPGAGVFDPRLNTRTTLGPHADYDLARVVGARGNYDLFPERESLASILFTNWMGDDGFLWKYSCQLRRFVVHGDTCWYTGKIIKKYIDDGKYCVDIDYWGDNQRGERATVGNATIILPSKVAGQVKYPAQRSIEDVFPAKK